MSCGEMTENICGEWHMLVRVFYPGSGLSEGWAHQDSNLGPSDYESDALTN